MKYKERKDNALFSNVMTIVSLEINLQAFMAVTDWDMLMKMDSKDFSRMILFNIFLRVWHAIIKEP